VHGAQSEKSISHPVQDSFVSADHPGQYCDFQEAAGPEKMLKAPIPVDDQARVDALNNTGLLDTPADERFDRYTRLVKRLFDVPIALVSLVDTNRQWFKSCIGLDVDETARDISFCGHTILDTQMFIVEDTEADDRFSDNPLVTGEPHIRFYAGYPLRGAGGHRLGTLCIIDQRPRTLNESDLSTLSDIGEMVAGELGSLQLASTDELTGLTNRRGFEMLTEQALAICRRGGEPASLLMIDMDGFKAINDQHGHEEGDRALIEFSRLLLTVFRESDVVARLGGDEFAVLLTGTNDADSQRALARLNEAVTERNQYSDRAYPLAFSGGTTTCQTDQKNQDIAELLRQADAQMYDQKRHKLEQRMSI